MFEFTAFSFPVLFQLPASAGYDGDTPTARGTQVGTGYEEQGPDEGFNDRVYYATCYHVPAVTIPQGATILSAYYTVYDNTMWEFARNQWKGVFALVDADTVDDTPTTYGEANALPLTSNTVEWNEPTDPDWYTPGTSPDLKDVFQEVVNRPGWTPTTNHMLIVWKDNGSTDPASDPDHPTYPVYNYAKMGDPSGGESISLVVTYVD